jgi:uncharacterized membrane protein YqjE
MAEPMFFRNPAGHRGLRANLASFVSSAARFLESRVTLAGREAKSAALHFATVVACLIIASVLMVFGSLFLIIFIIVGLAHLLGISWIWTTLFFALLLFAGALVCLVIARGQSKRPVFRETASVLKEDTEWLKNLDRTKAQRN